MAITKAEKSVYNDYIKDFKTQIDASYKRLGELEKKKKEMPRIKGYITVEAVVELLKIIMLNISMNDASFEILKIKNEAALKNELAGANFLKKGKNPVFSTTLFSTFCRR